MKAYNLTLTKTEFDYLNMLLNEVQNSPLIAEGRGFKMFAFVFQKKINGKQLRGNIHEAYKKAVQTKIRREITRIEKSFIETAARLAKQKSGDCLR